MEKCIIRVATIEDAKALLEIYAPYVSNTAISLELVAPSLEEFERRIVHILSKYPYLVAEREGEIIGYAYAGEFHPRAAFSRAVETSIYIKREMRCSGVGRALYEALERALALQNVLNLNACIAYPEIEDEYLTRNSVQFHEHLGYRMVGEFHKCGYKFNRWYDIVWMEKYLGEHSEHPEEVKTFAQIRGEWERA